MTMFFSLPPIPQPIAIEHPPRLDKQAIKERELILYCMGRCGRMEARRTAVLQLIRERDSRIKADLHKPEAIIVGSEKPNPEPTDTD